MFPNELVKKFATKKDCDKNSHIYSVINILYMHRIHTHTYNN